MLQNCYDTTNNIFNKIGEVIQQPASIIAPWLNLNYDDMEGEFWKELPYLGGDYLISNFSRIKSLDRTINGKDEKIRFYKGRILKGVIVRYKNKTIGDCIEEIKVGIFYCGKYCNIRLARMVYHLFIDEIDFKKDGNIVAHKDGNRFNNAASNLFLETVSNKQKKVIAAKRSIKLSDYQTKEGFAKAATARHKTITQFCLQGNPIKTYNSILEASKTTGIGSSAIINATKHKTMVSAGGFLWQYGCVTHPIDIDFYKIFMQQSKQVQGTIVEQIDKHFQILHRYKSIKQATAQTGIHYTNITQALNNCDELAGGFYWKRFF